MCCCPFAPHFVLSFHASGVKCKTIESRIMQNRKKVNPDEKIDCQYFILFLLNFSVPQYKSHWRYWRWAHPIPIERTRPTTTRTRLTIATATQIRIAATRPRITITVVVINSSSRCKTRRPIRPTRPIRPPRRAVSAGAVVAVVLV